MRTIFLLLLFILNIPSCFSQIINKEITTDKYKIILTWNDSVFYSGGIIVQNISDGNKVFSSDNFHSGYNSDKTVDLNNDGSSEYMLELETGNTRSDYNMYLIFNFSSGPEPLCEIHNAEIVSGVDYVSEILSNVRIGDPKLEAKYSFPVKYVNGKLILNNNFKESKVLKELVPFEDDYTELISGYSKVVDICDANSQVKNFFVAYITQQKIVGNESEGWKYFDTNYKCENKETIKEEIKKSVEENYSAISDPDNFYFKSKNN